jgi:hypothetical protein
VAFDFKIFYHPGSQNSKLYTWSQCLKYCPNKREIEDQLITTILSKKHFGKNIIEEKELIVTWKLPCISWIRWNIQLLGRVRAEGDKDEVYREELKKLREIYQEKKHDILLQEDGVIDESIIFENITPSY